MSNIKEIIEKADLKKQENKELQQEKFMYEITKEVKSINNNIKFFFWYFIVANVIYFLTAMGFIIL